MCRPLLPSDAVRTISVYLEAGDRLRLATFFRLPRIQAESFRILHSALPSAQSTAFTGLISRDFDAASSIGDTGLLDLLLECYRSRGIEPVYSTNALYGASRNGHVRVLQWRLQSGLRLSYNHDAMNWASRNGHVAVLEWWKESGLALLYSRDALDSATCAGQLAVLDWWRSSGLRMKYSVDVEFWGFRRRNHAVLRWWKEYRMEATELAFPY